MTKQNQNKAVTGPLAEGQRWSAARKREVVLRLLRDESVDALSRELAGKISWNELIFHLWLAKQLPDFVGGLMSDLQRLKCLPVSAVIVNYNAGNLLQACVAALLPQVAQVIVVDNASHDGSALACARHHAAQPALQWVRNTSNRGFAAACNQGWALATQPAVLFLNPDCVAAPEAVARLWQALQAPEVGMVGGLLLNPDGSEQRGARRYLPTPARAAAQLLGLAWLAQRWPDLVPPQAVPVFNLHQQPLPPEPEAVEAISGACMLVKRQAVAEVGLWDEGYFLHCEDLDWCQRFARHGWRVLFVPTARFVHAQGSCSRQRRLFVEWHKHRGMARFYCKFYRGRYPALLLWLVMVAIWGRYAALVLCFYGRRLLWGGA